MRKNIDGEEGVFNKLSIILFCSIGDTHQYKIYQTYFYFSFVRYNDKMR